MNKILVKRLGKILQMALGEIFLYDRNLTKSSDFNMWFFFPGSEAFAMSSIGYLWLFKELDETADINVERIYADSHTTRLRPEYVDVIAISTSFDFDFTKVFDFLKRNNFEILSKNRVETDPIIYAGGPVITSNPEPYKNIYDFMIIGDGEGINVEVVQTIKDGKCNGKTKAEILQDLSNIEGVYVPNISKSVKKVVQKLSRCIYTPILSERAFFPNTFIIEVERGCANRCGFCLASYINLPIRFVPYEELVEAVNIGLKYTNKLALLGAQVTAHPNFTDLCRYIENLIDSGRQIEVSVSSLRVDSFLPDIVKMLVKAGQKHLTLAVEAGSERLRQVINKNLSHEQIYRAIDVAVECGLKGIKFYAMLGLPTETLQDVNEILFLAKEIKTKYKGFNISFAFSTFVPKANTPFQWVGRENEKSLENKITYLKKEFHKIGVDVSISSAKWDYYQAVLSRGDERLSDYLLEVYNLGAKIGAYKKAAKNLGVNTDYYAIDCYEYSKNLPWDFIDIKPGKDFLIEESKRLLRL